MKRSFNKRISRFASLISILVLVALFALFFLYIAEFMLSPAGRAFAVIWASMAIIAFVAHSRNFSECRLRTPHASPLLEKEFASIKTQRLQRKMRGF
jgi:hypothetical protein